MNAVVKHTIARNRIQTAGLAFGGTGLCFYRVRGDDGSCQSINQSINHAFRVVQVTKSLQDPLEVGNSLLGISDNVRE